ncbi:MAG: hypothetical protein A3F67_05535 [Verrucomicrobia bacterium RIFCSPHIGHO2_12_FULL_41_10]|nr:MAG: hypothetical protein A3F67_05535 [Verrucomicrobia bacterium RIFCSPHIGHO2_12_FULL_41_10]HLB32613.1 glycosyltransferase family 39 protein [Chthoniobacterales bacterium]
MILPPASSLQPPGSIRSVNRIVLLGTLIILVTLFRFWYCTQLELTGDEAYYWYCSRHLDWSFFDKGPGAALTIFFGTHLFGDTVFGVRFFAVLLSAATGIGLYVLARILYSERVAFWTLLMALFMPLYAVGSILMTIDPLSIFFWTIAAIAFWKAVTIRSAGRIVINSNEEEDIISERQSAISNPIEYKKKNQEVFLWILAGAFIGMGMLAKYTNLVELLCFALFCFWSPKQRYQFKRPHFYIMIGTALLFSLPMIIWNVEHHAIGIVHLLQRGDLNKSWHITPSELLVFIGAQAGVISPLFFLGVMVSVFVPMKKLLHKDQNNQKDENHQIEVIRFLRSLFLPLFLFYGFLSLNKAAEPNWPAPCYIAGMILLAGNWGALKKCLPWVRALAYWAFAIAAFETIMLHNTFWLHLPVPARWEEQATGWPLKILKTYQEIGKVDPLDRAHGGESIALHALKIAQEQGTSFFISDNYQSASLLSFYLPGHPDTYEPSSLHVKDQFSIWPSYRDLFPSESTALFVYPWKYPPQDLRRDFSSITLVDEAYSLHGDRPIRKYYYSVCRNYSANRPNS